MGGSRSITQNLLGVSAGLPKFLFTLVSDLCVGIIPYAPGLKYVHTLQWSLPTIRCEEF